MWCHDAVNLRDINIQLKCQHAVVLHLSHETVTLTWYACIPHAAKEIQRLAGDFLSNYVFLTVSV